MSRPGQPAPDTANSRTRTFGGCTTCRARHVKCDEKRPSCSTCRQTGLLCEGYKKDIFFIPEHASSDKTTRYRRPLLTETERARMSQRLTTIVPPNAALRLLYQLDEECEKQRSSNGFRINHGPFGAFKLESNSFAASSRSDPRMVSRPETDRDSDSGIFVDMDHPERMIGSGSDIPFALEPSDLSWMQDVPTGSHMIPEQDVVPQFLDFSNSGPDYTQSPFEGLAFPDVELLPAPTEPAQSDNPAQLTVWAQSNHTPLYMTPRTAIREADLEIIPDDAVCLLKHYASNVIKSLTPFRHAKTPWHILFLPLSKSCLAALTMGEKIEHATLCVFMGTLAISAYGLGGTTQSQKWLQQADVCKERARKHVKLMLRSAYDVPKTAKYKTILMALITMSQLCIISGRRDQTECYLLEAEKFIRLRGLNRRKSRKVRLLHHCYVHLRLLHESTFLGGIDSKQRRHVREAVESSGTVAYFQDFPSFRLKHWNHLDREMLEIRSQEAAENDLFLERPGLWEATMYPEIFGIPEPWVFLLSQVIRLANEKDNVGSRSADDTSTIKAFMRRAKVLERCITCLDRLTSRNHTQNVDSHVIENVLYGMRCALEIYFYRRIYDVSSSMLQNKVIKTRDWLFRHEDTEQSKNLGYVEFIWPAFIAGSEAENWEVQQSFANWFRLSAQQSGLPCFTKTLELVERIRQAKLSDPDGESSTWLELMKKDPLLVQ